MPVASASAGMVSGTPVVRCRAASALARLLAQRVLALDVAVAQRAVAHGQRPVLLQQQHERLLLVGERLTPRLTSGAVAVSRGACSVTPISSRARRSTRSSISAKKTASLLSKFQ